MALEDNINEFLKEQSEETEEKTVNPIAVEKVVPTIGVNTNDFEPHQEETEESEQLAEQIKDVIPIDARKEARNYATMIDLTQRMAFTGLHTAKGKKKAGGKEAWNNGVVLLDDIESGLKNKKDLSDADRRNLLNVKRAYEKIKRLPMNEQEKEMFVDALEGLVQENGYKMPPYVMMFIALINMAVPRVTDLLMD